MINDLCVAYGDDHVRVRVRFRVVLFLVPELSKNLVMMPLPTAALNF